MGKFADCVAAVDKVAPAANRVDLWRLSLENLDSSHAGLSEILSPDEVLRAQRFHFAKDRLRFTFVRGSLRIILGEYLDLPPARIEFRYGKAGKPYLPDQINPLGLRFNVSHSGGFALVAAAWGRELGVDIEQIRPDVNIRDVAGQFFSGREVAEIFSLPAEQQSAAFFRCWTRKEAYVKATGEGITFPLHSFGVSVKPEDPARLVFVDGAAAELKRWMFQDISPSASHAAALAVEGADWEICIRNAAGS
jgi:4'-phosphopantetheinyl transferase